ncbi:MAG: prepilin-type N-terminal cleavage/methylation domain-containing protein [Candidatus Gracilibacteria bacterium]|jgi:prepilin-type N-terminal cleavage/methylation domain-containing protein
MKQYITSDTTGFTLVELLVVITILAIISITAYTSFSGSTDKAKNSTKLGHIASIETGLNTFFSEKNYYPMPSQYSATNLWGFSGTLNAAIANTFSGSKNGDAIVSVSGGLLTVGGGKVNDTTTAQIGAKGTVDSDVLSKQYLSQDLSDPSIKDIKVGSTETLRDYGIGEYVYGVYAKSNTNWTTTSKKGSAYNLAIVIADDQKGTITKVLGNFDKSTCINCPNTLIGSGTANNNLKDGESYAGDVFDANTRVAYPISRF